MICVALFAPPTSLIAESPLSVSLADFNGDGALDIVTATPKGVALFSGRGDGTFPAPAIFPVGTVQRASSVVAADLNRDGKTDIVASIAGSRQGLTDSVSVLLGDGKGGFQPPRTLAPSDGGATSVTVADLDADGSPDLVVPHLGRSVQVLVGNGDGTFRPEVEVESAQGAHSLVAQHVGMTADVDLIGRKLDGVALNWGIGKGMFQSGTEIRTSLGLADVLAADLDRNGWLDLIIVNELANEVGVFANDGKGLGPIARFSAGRNPVAAASKDLDGDTVPDLVVANSRGNDVSVFRGKGDGTLRSFTSYSVGMLPNAVGSGDLNADGDLDLVTADGGGTITVLLARAK